MSNRFRAIACLVALLAVVRAQHPPVPVPSAPATPSTDPCIATVGDREVLLSDLIAEVDRQIPLNFYHRRLPTDQMATFRREAFDKLVVKHLIHLDALDRGLAVGDEELRVEFEAALKEAGSEYAALAAAAREALFDEVRPGLEKRVLIRKNEERVTAAIARPTDAMMQSLYDERIAADPTAFMAPREAHYFQIFVGVDPSRIRHEEESKRAKIDAAMAELVAGKPFGTVARIYSEDEFAEKGGDLGMQQVGSFRMQAIGDAAKALGVGETSEVIRSLHGFHILRCTEEKPPARHSFADMRAAIEQWLLEEHLKVARARWLAELRGKHAVVLVRGDLIEGSGDGAATKTPTPTPQGQGQGHGR